MLTLSQHTLIKACQLMVTALALCLVMNCSQAQNQPTEHVWSPSYSVVAKSIMGNPSGWWIAGRRQSKRKDHYRPFLLLWQPAADSFNILDVDDPFNRGKGDVGSLQKQSNGSIIASTFHANGCGMPSPPSVINRTFISSDSSSIQWNSGFAGFFESYRFPSDSTLVIADSLYAVNPNGQAFESKTHNMKSPVRHVPYLDDQVAMVGLESIKLYNQQGTQLYQNMSIDSLHATHWQGDTIAATDGDTLVYYNDSLQILAQKDLSADFSSAPVLTTWQDRLLVAGLTPQGTEWHVKAITMNQQMSTLVTFGDSSWRLKDMYVQDSVLGLTGGQQKRNSSALLFKTIHLPDTVQDRSVDVALTDTYTDNISFESISQANL